MIRTLGDYIALYPKGTDPSWRTGPKGVLIRYADPADRVVVQFFPGGRVDYAFFHAHSTLLTWIYNETGLVEIVILENATLPESGRRLGVESSAVALSDHMERRKLHCHEPWYKTILKDFDPVTGFVEAFKAAGHLILGLISLTVESEFCEGRICRTLGGE